MHILLYIYTKAYMYKSNLQGEINISKRDEYRYLIFDSYGLLLQILIFSYSTTLHVIWWFSCASFHFCSIFGVWKTHVRDGARTRIPNDCIVTGIIALEYSDSNDFNHLCPRPARVLKIYALFICLCMGIGLRIPELLSWVVFVTAF